MDGKSGIITTFAGGGGQRIDGVPATEAALLPGGLAVDAAGNLFVADRESRVRRVDAVTRIITTVAGTTIGFGGDGAPAAEAKLNMPMDVAFDAAGNLYIAISRTIAFARSTLRPA